MNKYDTGNPISAKETKTTHYNEVCDEVYILTTTTNVINNFFKSQFNYF